MFCFILFVNTETQKITIQMFESQQPSKYKRKPTPICSSQNLAMEQHISFIFIYYRGASKKVLQFLMPVEPIYNKSFVLINKNAYYEHCHKVETVNSHP